jgi:hypothetical protein
MTDDAPTLPLPGIRPAPQPGPPAPRRRGVVAVFVILCVLVVAAIVVLVVVLASRGSVAQPGALATPSISPTASAPPPPAPTATVPPAPAPTFTSLRAAAMQQDCFRGGHGHGGHGPGKHGDDTATPSIRVSWQTANASEVWVAKGPGDAAGARGVKLPTSGDQGDFPSPVTYDCTERSETFTMTLVGADGQHVSRSWTVQNPRRSVF